MMEIRGGSRLRIRVSAEEVQATRELVPQYAEAAQETLAALERQLTFEERARTVSFRRKNLDRGAFKILHR